MELLLMSDVTQILGRMQGGEKEAAEELLPLIYEELRRMASSRMQNEKPGHTLQATALVHEAWMRLIVTDQGAVWESREGFLAAAAEAMRRILVDSARRKAALKRGGLLEKRSLEAVESAVSGSPEEVIAVNEALDVLQCKDPVAAELVKLHFFAGLSLEEAGELLNLSRATAYRTWTYAKTFLKATLSD